MRTAKTTLVLLLFWCVIVPPEGWVDVLVGLVAALLLALWAVRFLWPQRAPLFSSLHPTLVPGFLLHTLMRIVVSAWQVLRIVVDPRLPIAPEMLTQTVRFESDAARVAFANAITLTPGTLTVDVDGDVFTVHALDRSLAQDVIDGSLEREIAHLFERRSDA